MKTTATLFEIEDPVVARPWQRVAPNTGSIERARPARSTGRACPGWRPNVGFVCGADRVGRPGAKRGLGSQRGFPTAMLGDHDCLYIVDL